MAGKSAAWHSRNRVYGEVREAIGLDLGISRSCAVGRLPGERWRSFCWDGNQLRQHPLLDADLLVMFGSPRPVTELPCEQIQRHVARELKTIEAGGKLPVERAQVEFNRRLRGALADPEMVTLIAQALAGRAGSTPGTGEGYGDAGRHAGGSSGAGR